jgi:hypothetical protein
VLTTAAAVTAIVASGAPAFAFEDFVGTRALGMGQASRAWAVGNAGPLLNPSGMSLVKSYSVEGSYGYTDRVPGHFLHAAIVDNTSAYNIAGGVYYTYHDVAAMGRSGHGHEGGVAFSLPFGNFLSLGATVKYFRLRGDDAMPIGETLREGGVTFDLGATLRPVPVLSFAMVGTNLRDLHNGHAPQGLGYGVAVTAVSNLVISLDGRTRFTPDHYTNRKGTSVMGGAELTIVQRFAARLGGGYDALTGNGYGAAGFSALSEIGAFDAGIRYDLFQGELAPGMPVARSMVVGVGLRLFVPATQSQQPPL